MKNVTLLPYPSRKSLREWDTDGDAIKLRIFERVRASDRAVLYNGQGTGHYEWYYEKIISWFDETKPDVILGEAAGFYSHMTALIAAERNIPFLNPMPSRYPRGRFTFTVGDRLRVLGGSEERWQPDVVSEVIERINGGNEVPDYMSLRPSKLRQMHLQALGAIEWFKGERYTTKSPISFLTNIPRVASLRRRWDALANPLSDLDGPKEGPRVLYPMQLQPEMNLDTWGYQYRQQDALIRQLAREVGATGGTLWVKQNPKASMELNESLFTAFREEGVRLLPADVPMSRVSDKFDLIVTVSGTVAIERLLHNRDVAILLDDYADWLGVKSTRSPSAPDLNGRILVGDHAGTNPGELMQRLVATSYEGLVSAPALNPASLRDENVVKIAAAIDHVIAPFVERSSSERSR